MWIRERIENPPSYLSTWRKSVLVVAAVFTLLVAFIGFDKHMEIQATAPDHPVPARGQVYPIDVNHGYIRYVNWKDKESFSLWGLATSWVGAVDLLAFFVWLTAPRETDPKKIRPSMAPKA